MPFVSFTRTYIAGRNALIDHMKDTLVSAGWTLIEDLTGTATYGYALRSRGVSGVEFPIFLHIRVGTGSTRIEFHPCRGWTTGGVGARMSYYDSTYHFLNCTGVTTWSWIIGSANEDGCCFFIFNGTTWHYFSCFMVKPLRAKIAHGVLQSDIPSDANTSQTIQLAAGEADNFVVGKNYSLTDGILSKWVTVSAVDTVNHTVTASPLSYNPSLTSLFAMIGDFPDRWMTNGMPAALEMWVCRRTTWDGGTANATRERAWKYILSAWGDPDALSGQVYLEPFLITCGGQSAVFGLPLDTTLIRACHGFTASEVPIAVGAITTGTSTGSNGVATLNDTSKAWTTNDLANKTIIVTDGRGAGQIRKISSNTGTQIVISVNWDTIPDETSSYTVCEQGWLYMAPNNSASYGRAVRMT